MTGKSLAIRISISSNLFGKGNYRFSTLEADLDQIFPLKDNVLYSVTALMSVMAVGSMVALAVSVFVWLLVASVRPIGTLGRTGVLAACKESSWLLCTSNAVSHQHTFYRYVNM